MTEWDTPKVSEGHNSTLPGAAETPSPSRPSGRPTIDQSDVDRILAVLDCGEWVKGKDLARIAGVRYRMIRAAAEQTGAIISSQRGYKLTELATEAEIYASYADLMSRAAHITARAERLNRALSERQLGLPL